MKPVHSSYEKTRSYVTKDGSRIRELMHPRVHGNRHQSLAEAVVPAGACTRLHRHHRSEEIYYITSGRGRMTLGGETFAVGAGDVICIPPGTPHCVENREAADLRILCCCAPAYSHEDTELLNPPAGRGSG